MVKGGVETGQMWVAVTRLRGRVRREDGGAGKGRRDLKRAIRGLNMMWISIRRSLSRFM